MADPHFAQLALKAVRDAVVVMDDQGKVVLWNSCAVEMFGYGEDEMIGADLHATIVPNEYRTIVPSFLADVGATVINRFSLLEGTHKSGRLFPIELELSRMQQQGRCYVTATIRDMSQQHRHNLTLHNAEQRQGCVNLINQIGLCDYSLTEKLQQTLIAILGLSWFPVDQQGAIFLMESPTDTLRLTVSVGLSEVHKQQCATLNVGDCLCGQMAATREVKFTPNLLDAEGLGPCQGQLIGHCAIPLIGSRDQLLGLLSCHTVVDYQPDDTELLSLVTISDCLASLIERHQLCHDLTITRQLIEQSPISVAVTDTEGLFTYTNPAFSRISGYSAEEVLGSTARILKSGETPAEVYQSLWSNISAGRQWRGEILNRKKNGELFWESEVVSPLRGDDGKIIGYAALKEDITAQKQFNDQLRALATRDTVTGLPNAVLIRDRLEQAINTSMRAVQQGAVICVDIASMGTTNDTYGNAFGDKLLHEVGQRILQQMRGSDSVGRHLSDTFIVIANDLKDQSHLEQLLGKLTASIEQPMSDVDNLLKPRVRFGCVFFPLQGDSVDCLIDRAIMALNHTKRQSTGNWALYNSEIDVLVQNEGGLAVDLEHALSRGELQVYYQPKVNAQSGVIHGAEALMRWEHPIRGMVSPVDFIPLAEKSGQIIEIGRWLIAEVVGQTKLWSEEFIMAPAVSINLSPRQFSDPELVKYVTKTIADQQLDPRLIGFELTESVLIDSPQAAGQVMQQISDLGCFISIDDYGTGYSSLSYIHKYPVKELKIDRSFITDLTTVPSNAVIVRSTLSMCRSLGIEVVAEGVEDMRQANYLTRHGCDILQGFMFSKPVPAKAFVKLLQRPRHFKDLLIEPDLSRSLLLLDDEPNVLQALQRLLRHESYTIYTATTPEVAFDLLAEHEIGVVISDQRMPQITGTEFLARVADLYPLTVRMILSGYTEIDAILSSINRGSVFKFLTKPSNEDELRDSIESAFQQYEVSRVKDTLEGRINSICQEFKLVWDEHFSVDIEQLDRDHRHLMALYNRIVDLYFKTDEYTEAMETMLLELVDSANSHFDSEEQLMHAAGYHHCASHRQGHKALRQSLHKILSDYQQQDLEHSFIHTLSFLKQWLQEHIVVHDVPTAVLVNKTISER